MATKAEKNRAWKAANPDKVRVNARRYYAKNREAILARDKARRAAASPEQRARTIAYFQARYQAQKAARRTAMPPDPVTLLSDLELSYLAGLIDGEGCITITNTGLSFGPNLAISMTHAGVMYWVAERLCLRVWRPSIAHPKPHYRPQYKVQVVGVRCGLLCQRLLPYLIVKREQAQIAMDFAATLDKGRHPTAETLARRKQWRIQIQALNQRRDPVHRIPQTIGN